jgi:phage repressor protein C with HTH and peptisase S24 domain
MPALLNRLYKLGCNVNWLLTGEGEMIRQKDSPGGKTRLIPVLAEVECGMPVYNQINQENIKMFELADVSHYNSPFIVIARGDSMRPYINPGDYLLCVDEPMKIKDGSAVVVNFKTIPETYSSNAKLIKFLKDESIMLYSINTKFPPTIHKKSEIYKIYKVVRLIREVK